MAIFDFKLHSSTLFVLGFLIATVFSAVIVNPVTNVTSNNLMYTGTIGIGSTNQKLFYAFYGKDGESNPDNLSKNVLIISVGSAGRSAQYSNVGGLGPKFLMTQLNIIDNPYSLTKFANIIFIDQLGSGYSYPTNIDTMPKTSKDYASQLSKAIISFTTQTNIGKSKKIYLIGQSTFLRSVPFLDDISGLEGIVHLSGWPDLYAVGKYYGTGGVELKIFTDAERITIDGTFTNCYNFQRSSKFVEAHSCYDTTLNYVETKTKNRNLYNIQLMANLTEFLPLTQYYFSQSSAVNTYKAPNTAMFENYASQVQSNLYEDLARNLDSSFSQYLKDELSVRHIFVTADDDFIVFRRGIRNWLENTIQFVQSSKFKPLNLTVLIYDTQEYTIDGKVVGYRKSVTQVSYYELVDCGHFSYHDQPKVIHNIVKQFIGVNSQEPQQKQNLQLVQQ